MTDKNENSKEKSKGSLVSKILPKKGHKDPPTDTDAKTAIAESDQKVKPDGKKKAKAEAEKKAKAEAEKKAKAEAHKKEKKKPSAKDEALKQKKGIRYLGGLLLAKMARAGAAELRSNADEVNQLNVFPVPDGDTGDNMSMTIDSGVKAIENLDTDNLAEVMRTLSHGMLLGARGNSGVILSQFFAGVAQGFEDSNEADPKTLGAALELGVKQAYSTVMTPTEGTILTVAREAVEYAVSKITPQTTIRSFFSNFVNEMHASVERTPELLPALKEAGVVDSGGAGLFYIMDGFNRVLNGEDIVCDEPKRSNDAKVTDISGFGPDSVMEYEYCTELLVQLTRAKCDIDAFDIDALREFLVGIGNSVVAFKTDTVVKLHVHTLSPDKVLAYMLSYGEFITVKVENMSVQHTAVEEAKSDGEGNADESAPIGLFTPKAPMEEAPERKKYGIVAVSNGAGIDALFHDLGVDETVFGGQTKNPSAGDFLDAFSRINAECIFVFPNNSNILLAASQAAGIYDKAKVYVIPSKSIGTGYVALCSINLDDPDPEAITRSCEEAMLAVECGYVSPAIRDTQMNGLEIKSGDTIGIIGKQIVVDERERSDAALALAAKLLEGERFMLTIFCGIDAGADECAMLEEKIIEQNPGIEVYMIDAGQDVYPYIFIAE